MAAPTRRCDRDAKTVENAAATVTTAGMSNQPRLSKTAVTPRTSHVSRDARLVNTMKATANVADSMGSMIVVPVGWQPANAAPIPPETASEIRISRDSSWGDPVRPDR
jgi:hypothetical protein